MQLKFPFPFLTPLICSPLFIYLFISMKSLEQDALKAQMVIAKSRDGKKRGTLDQLTESPSPAPTPSPTPVEGETLTLQLLVVQRSCTPQPLGGSAMGHNYRYLTKQINWGWWISVVHLAGEFLKMYYSFHRVIEPNDHICKHLVCSSFSLCFLTADSPTPASLRQNSALEDSPLRGDW